MLDFKFSRYDNANELAVADIVGRNKWKKADLRSESVSPA